jgi:methylmalonyl-CoA mutase
MRLAEPFEQLRDASDRILATTGERPKVFLANLGTLAEFTPRATFAKNFFEAGGIETVTSDGYPDRDAMVAAFKGSHATLACLCATEARYAADGAEAARALAPAGARHIYLTGRPKEQDTLKLAGVGTFIYAGCDALAILKAAYAALAAEGLNAPPSGSLRTPPTGDPKR